MSDDEPTAPPPRQPRHEGWKEIANAMGITVRAAQERALRPYDPLPVRVAHTGPWAHKAAIRDWVMRQDMPYGAAVQLKRFARIPRVKKPVRDSDTAAANTDETSH